MVTLQLPAEAATQDSPGSCPSHPPSGPIPRAQTVVCCHPPYTPASPWLPLVGVLCPSDGARWRDRSWQFVSWGAWSTLSPPRVCCTLCRGPNGAPLCSAEVQSSDGALKAPFTQSWSTCCGVGDLSQQDLPESCPWATLGPCQCLTAAQPHPWTGLWGAPLGCRTLDHSPSAVTGK